MNNQDKKMLEDCTSEEVIQLFNGICCEHPLDNDVVAKLKDLGKAIPKDSDDYEIFRHRSDTDDLWSILLKKSIKCLRYYDKREPFIGSNGKKFPKAYGIDDLKKYYDKYTDFENILYGSSHYYRDHVIHVFRTWLLGIKLLCKNDGEALNKMQIHEKSFSPSLEPIERVSMWTIIALTHDLGYPLQKAKSIIDVTRNMVSTFIANPDISVDFAFHGVQNYMNDFVVRLMSSKMRKVDKSENTYVARLQPKYYFKFQKSLERNSHGILSTLIIYKLLTYFLESDYSINEDYTFNEEDCRQFYIRREILRAIASHTCDDVYQMYMGSFSFLLRICDDAQEWGRKNISELYVKSGQDYELKDISLQFCEGTGSNKCTIRERMSIFGKDGVSSLIKRFREQALVYITIFRDGQDTESRDFSFHRELEIVYEDNITLIVNLEVDKDQASALHGTISYVSEGKKNRAFGKDFFESISKGSSLTIFDEDNQECDVKKPQNWHKGQFVITLSK